MYRYVATSQAGFIQQLACRYIATGYWFYVTGKIPKRKQPEAVDAKILATYDIPMSKFQRARRKKAGQASIQYLRHARFFIIVATHGQHFFFEDHGKAVRDCRQEPIKFFNYAIGYRGGHASVRISRPKMRELRAYFDEIATQRSEAALLAEIDALPFARYAPVRSQLLILWRSVNHRRKTAGLAPLPPELSLGRQPVKPFEP